MNEQKATTAVAETNSLAEAESGKNTMSATEKLLACGELRFTFKQKGKNRTRGVLSVIKNLDGGGSMPILSDTLDIGNDKRRGDFVDKLYSISSELEATVPKADTIQKLMLYSCILEMATQPSKKSSAELGYPMTGMGNAKLFGDLFRDKVRYNVTSGKWLAWDGHRWSQENGEIQVQLCCRKVADYWYKEMGESVDSDDRKKIARHWVDSSSAKGVRDMLFLARSEQGISISHTELDTDIYLLNVLDGTIDLRTGKRKDPDPNDLITMLANVSYMPGVESIPIPKWEKSLKEWHPGGDEDGTWEYLQMLMGYCLTGDIGSRLFSIWWGGGKNGKNSFLDTFLLMLGDYATVAMRTLLEAEKIDRHPTEIADLWKKRLVIASEPKKGTKLKIGIVKAMTGDSLLAARFMRRDPFKFTPTHKMIMMTQNLPVVEETQDAIWDRIHKLPWLTRIPKENQIPHYSEKYLKDEWPGILRWAIEGYLKLRKTPQGILFSTKKIERETQQYRDEQNPAKKFVDAMFIIAPGMFTTSADVNKRFSDWVGFLDGSVILTKSDLDKYLNDAGCINKTKTANGKTERGWFSLGLRN